MLKDNVRTISKSNIPLALCATSLFGNDGGILYNNFKKTEEAVDEDHSTPLGY